MNKPVTSINELSRNADRFHVQANCVLNNVVYVFGAVGQMGARKATFNCHVYESPYNSRYSAHVKTATVPTDHGSNNRFHGEAFTLEDLVYNMDWPHFPSELALLKAMLSKCDTTNDSTRIGELVNLRLSDEEHAMRVEFLRRKADETVAFERERVQREALSLWERESTSTHAALAHGCMSYVTPAAHAA